MARLDPNGVFLTRTRHHVVTMLLFGHPLARFFLELQLILGADMEGGLLDWRIQSPIKQRRNFLRWAKMSFNEAAFGGNLTGRGLLGATPE
jgi:hypothetical protein